MCKTIDPPKGHVRFHELECGRFVKAADLLTASLIYLDAMPAEQTPVLAGLLSWLAPILGE